MNKKTKIVLILCSEIHNNFKKYVYFVIIAVISVNQINFVFKLQLLQKLCFSCNFIIRKTVTNFFSCPLILHYPLKNFTWYKDCNTMMDWFLTFSMNLTYNSNKISPFTIRITLPNYRSTTITITRNLILLKDI